MFSSDIPNQVLHLLHNQYIKIITKIVKVIKKKKKFPDKGGIKFIYMS